MSYAKEELYSSSYEIFASQTQKMKSDGTLLSYAKNKESDSRAYREEHLLILELKGFKI